jgi:hypothetical protein
MAHTFEHTKLEAAQILNKMMSLHKIRILSQINGGLRTQSKFEWIQI